MKNRNPWFKTQLQQKALGHALKYDVPHDVFSTLQIDEGTTLLLDHLPKFTPETVLDMGCGYGALGLPIAACFPNAQVEMVDRDLLAVAWSARNAESNRLANVSAYGSLGFRDLRDPQRKYDWILCNIPARIGTPFIEDFLQLGRSKLRMHGELRIVVIRDLVPVIEQIAQAHAWTAVETARGPRHSIFSFSAQSESPSLTPKDLYLRDTIEVGGILLDRPFDFGGDDPKRLKSGLPVLIDALPRQVKPQSRVLTFRSGYGALPLLALKRWPGVEVTACERDLLGTTFIRRNAERLGCAGPSLRVRECSDFVEELETSHYQLVLGELSPSAGPGVALSEIRAISQSLAPGGQALLLMLDKMNREWIKPNAAQLGATLSMAIARENYTVLRLHS